jgi:hypothetical protein
MQLEETLYQIQAISKVIAVSNTSNTVGERKIESWQDIVGIYVCLFACLNICM